MCVAYSHVAYTEKFLATANSDNLPSFQALDSPRPYHFAYIWNSDNHQTILGDVEIVDVGNAEIAGLQGVATNTLPGQLSDRVGGENWICINQPELTQYVHKYKHGQTNKIQT